MEWLSPLVLVLTIPFILLPVVLVWYFLFSGAYQAWSRRVTGKQVCTVDVDCPSGYICEGGICVPAS